jgi:hypothetical protein
MSTYTITTICTGNSKVFVFIPFSSKFALHNPLSHQLTCANMIEYNTVDQYTGLRSEVILVRTSRFTNDEEWIRRAPQQIKSATPRDK